MGDWKKITKKQFDAAYDNHLPNGWIRFAYKYFSTETERVDFVPKKIIAGILLGLFGLGMLGTILKVSRTYILPVTITYSILLVIFVLYLFSAVFFNNGRIRKIRKILGITKYEYNALISKFYG
jgi:hypothetical protein